MTRYIENSKLCFRDMKIMSRRNGGDKVNNESASLKLHVCAAVRQGI